MITTLDNAYDATNRCQANIIRILRITIQSISQFQKHRL